VDVKTVQRAIVKLRELGLLEAIRDSSRPGSPYVYRLTVTRHSVSSVDVDVVSVGDMVSLPIVREPSVEPIEATICRVCGIQAPPLTKLIDRRRNVHGEDVPLEEEAA